MLRSALYHYDHQFSLVLFTPLPPGYFQYVIEVNLYQPGSLNISIQFPADWNDLHTDEVMEVCKQQLIPGNTQALARAAILRFIINFRTRMTHKKLPAKWMQLVDAEDAVLNGYPLLDFIYNDNTLTKSPEHKIKLPGILPLTVYSPGNTFENITCGEYEDAQFFFNEFYADPAGDPLARLASVLWRPKNTPYIRYNYKTDAYTTYNSSRVLKRFKALHPARLYAIFTWYNGCSNLMPKLFPTVHEKHADKKQEVDIMAFTKCIHAAAGPKNGTRAKIRMMKLYELMFDMEQEAIAAKKLKELANA